MINFLSLLGWSYDDKTELMNVKEIIERFTAERICQTAAIFNKEKLDWMNGVYIRQLGADDLVDRVMPFLDKNLPAIVARYKEVFSPWNYDPQKIGKAISSYNQVVDLYKMAYAGIL